MKPMLGQVLYSRTFESNTNAFIVDGFDNKIGEYALRNLLTDSEEYVSEYLIETAFFSSKRECLEAYLEACKLNKKALKALLISTIENIDSIKSDLLLLGDNE